MKCASVKFLLEYFMPTRHQEDVKNNNNLKRNDKEGEIWRNLLAYWILGLCTEIGYIIIISAAHDILHSFEFSNEPDVNPTEIPLLLRNHSDAAIHYQQVCEKPSAGILLVADIVPAVLMSILCPFLPLIRK